MWLKNPRMVRYRTFQLSPVRGRQVRKRLRDEHVLRTAVRLEDAPRPLGQVSLPVLTVTAFFFPYLLPSFLRVRVHQFIKSGESSNIQLQTARSRLAISLQLRGPRASAALRD